MDRRVDIAALEDLLRERAWLDRLVAGLVGSTADCDDVAQRTIVHVLSARGRIRNLRGYLASVARGFALNLKRDRERREARQRAASSRELATDADPSLLAERAELQRRLIDALLALDEPQRSILLLRFHGERSPAEIATLLTIPAPTVRSHLRRGLERLRERLDRDPGCRDWRAILVPAFGARTGAGAAALLLGGFVVKWKLAAVASVLLFAASSALLTVEPGDASPSGAETLAAPPGTREVGVISASGADAKREAVLTESTGSDSPSSSPKLAEPLRASVRGRVIREGTLAPIGDVAVRILAIVEKPVEPVRTAGDGSFVLEGLDVDRPHRFELLPPGSLGTHRDVTLPAAGSHDVEFRLPPDVALRGRVVDAVSREPIVGAKVVVSSLSMSGPERPKLECVTGTDGGFGFGAPESLLAGLYLQVSHPGYVSTHMPIVDVAAIEAPLWRPTRIEGIVRFADGAIATGSSVQIWQSQVEVTRLPKEQAWPSDLRLVSRGPSVAVDAFGRFAFDDAAPWSTVRIQANDPSGSYTAIDVATVAPGTSAYVEIFYWPRTGSAALEGTFTVNGKGAPVPYRMTLSGASKPQRFVAGSDGRFRHEGLPGGFASLTVDATGIASPQLPEYKLVDGETTRADVELKIETSWIGGRVTRRDGSPASGVGVAIRGTESAARVGVNTDADGRFRVLTTLAPGAGAIARVAVGAAYHEQELKGGDEDAKIVLPDRGRVLLRIVDAVTRAPIPAPVACLVDPSGARRELMSNMVRKLPGDLVEIELDLGARRLAIDRVATFYSPAIVDVTASLDPPVLVVEVPPPTTGSLRVEISDEGNVVLPRKRLGYAWRPSGSNEPYRRISVVAQRRTSERLVEIELPAGVIELGVEDRALGQIVSLFPSLTITTGQVTSVKVREEPRK